MFFLFALFLLTPRKAGAFCGENIKWAHHFNIEDVYGVWYGVGYAQHTPDMTNKPNEVGCVTLYIGDATTEGRDVNDWLDWSVSPGIILHFKLVLIVKAARFSIVN